MSIPQNDYARPNGKLTFDRLSSVFISNTNHEENQPAHLTLKDASVLLFRALLYQLLALNETRHARRS